MWQIKHGTGAADVVYANSRHERKGRSGRAADEVLTNSKRQKVERV